MSAGGVERSIAQSKLNFYSGGGGAPPPSLSFETSGDAVFFLPLPSVEDKRWPFLLLLLSSRYSRGPGRGRVRRFWTFSSLSLCLFPPSSFLFPVAVMATSRAPVSFVCVPPFPPPLPPFISSPTSGASSFSSSFVCRGDSAKKPPPRCQD